MTELRPQKMVPRHLLVSSVLFTVCLMGTIIFIFANSSQIGEVSGEKSAIITEYANRIISWFSSSFRFTEQLIRKLAHFAEYALLGFWLILTLRVYTQRIVSFISWPLFLGLFVAVVDEFYQLLIPGRSGEIKDVIIDFAGVIAGLIIGLLVLLLFSVIWEAFHSER